MEQKILAELLEQVVALANVQDAESLEFAFERILGGIDVYQYVNEELAYDIESLAFEIHDMVVLKLREQLNTSDR